MPTPNKGAMPQQQQEFSANDIRRQNQEAEQSHADYQEPDVSGNGEEIDHNSPQRKEQVADIVRRQQQESARDHEDFMSNVAARRREHMRQQEMEEQDFDQDDNESLDNPDDVDENQEQDEVEVGAQEAQQQTEQQPAQDDKPGFFTDANGNQMARLRVDGQMKVVPADVALAALQKLNAGDERLRQASEWQRQLEQRERELNARAQAQPTQHQPSTPDAASDEIRAKLRTSFDKLYNEGDETAIDDIVNFIAERNPATPAVDPDAIAQRAITLSNQRNWDATLAHDVQVYETSEEFADVVGNDYLSSQAVERVKQLAPTARDRGIRPLDLIREVVSQVRSEAEAAAQALGYQKATTQQPQQAQSRQSQVAARKQQLGNTVVSGGAQRTMTTAEQRQAPAGGPNPNSREAKLKAFASLSEMREKPAFKR